PLSLQSFPTRRSSDLHHAERVPRTTGRVLSVLVCVGSKLRYVVRQLHPLVCVQGMGTFCYHLTVDVDADGDRVRGDHYRVTAVIDRKSTRLNSSHVKI